MSTLTINVNHIYSMADKRPRGYVDRVLSLGEVKEGVLHVKDVKGYVNLLHTFKNMEQFSPNGNQASNQEMARIASITPSMWGPPLWKDFHEKAQAGKISPEWLTSFEQRIPCGDCRKHFQKLMKEMPPRFNDQWLWSVDIHNEVNKKLEKPIFVPEV